MSSGDILDRIVSGEAERLDPMAFIRTVSAYSTGDIEDTMEVAVAGPDRPPEVYGDPNGARIEISRDREGGGWAIRHYDSDGDKQYEQVAEAVHFYGASGETPELSLTEAGLTLYQDGATTLTIRDGEFAAYRAATGEKIVISGGALTGYDAAGVATLAWDNLLGTIGYTGLLDVKGKLRGGVDSVFHAHQTVAQTIAANVATRLQFDTVVSDPDGRYNTTSDTFTALRSGWHAFRASAYFANLPTTAVATLDLRRNSTEVLDRLGERPGRGGTTGVVGGVEVYLSQGDFVHAYLAHTDTVARNTLAGQALTNFRGRFVGY